MSFGNSDTIFVCNGQVIDKKIKHESISKEEFDVIVQELKNYLLYIEGESFSSYDNSDDERWGSSSSSHKIRDYREINPEENSEHLIVIDGKVRGIVFYVSEGYSGCEYYQFFFDGSRQQKFRLGYSASHSSNFVYIEKVSLVKKGENGVPTEGRKIYFRHSRMDTYI